MNLQISQNFINNDALVEKLILASGIGKSDVVYDIGAGKGALSKVLAKYASKVIAFEIDKNLETELKTNLAVCTNVDVFLGDFLKFRLPDQLSYKVFSNIPFSITSDIVNKLVFTKNPPEDSYLFMQKESALRFMGKGEGVLISLLLKPFFDLKIIHEFESTDFSPAPSVEVVLLNIKKAKNPKIPFEHKRDWENFIAYILLQQKPSLKIRVDKIFKYNQFVRLSNDLNFSKDVIASELSFQQWLGLFKYYLVGVDADKKSIVNSSEKYISTKGKKLSGVSRSKIRS